MAPLRPLSSSGAPRWSSSNLMRRVIAGCERWSWPAARVTPPRRAIDTKVSFKRTVLFRGDLEGAPGKEIVVFVADLAPGAVGSKHYHPGPEFFYVLEGTLAHEPEGGSPQCWGS